MAYTVNNFVTDRILRGMMVSSADDTILWSLSQITNPSLSCSTETQDAVDMLGTPVITFERAKTVEFSGENALFDLGLFAAQSGTEVETASATQKIVAPIFETITLGEDPTAAVALKHAPIGQIMEIHVLNGDSTLGTRYVNGASASDTEFVHAEGSNQLTPPTGLTKGMQLFVRYDYEAEEAVAVVNSANNFPKAGKFIMEVLGCDVCDQTTLVHAYIIMDNAKLTSDFDITFATDSTHGFTIKANQAYCSADRQLVRIIIPKED